MIEIKNVSKTYITPSGNVYALKDVSLTVEKGDIMGVVGTSGAGKSTFVRCINLLERPESGEIIIDGKNIMQMTQKQLQAERSEIGMIFQQFNLMDQKTVFKNVAYPLEYKGISKEAIRERVESLLELVGISDKINAYPSQLSGGQKQRVAIARALAANPKVLLCDEATSALDPETTKSILRLLKKINRELNLSLIIITHQKEVVKEICNRVVVLSQGEIVDRGTAVDIFTKPNSDITRAFIGDILDDENVREVLELHKNGTSGEGGYSKIAKLTFIGDNAGEAFISSISKKFDLSASILFGNIEIIQSESVGILIVKITGDKKGVEEAVRYLKENKILVSEVA